MNTPTLPEIFVHFAAALGVPVQQNRIDIPEAFGSGYCIGYQFNEYIRMLILNYELQENILLTDTDKDIKGKMILFKFQHVLPKKDQNDQQLPSVLIATRKIQAEIRMPIHTHTSTINIEVDASYLGQQFMHSNQTSIINSLFENKQPLVFEQTLYPSLLPIVTELTTEHATKPFGMFLLRLKAEELICRLLMELDKRQEKQLLPLNQQDIQHLYTIREKILQHLDTPPKLADLAKMANMSTSKLKILFKQVFGKSVYSYYQQFRLQEAARLLHTGAQTVSQVGYQLGFSNLSHFSRVFEQHFGLKPKKFAMQK